ncbi:hypothetical protein ACVILI_002617 [Mesorhizobium sp. USDA 4775]
MPAKPDSIEQSTKHASFTLAVGMPIEAAAGWKPPVAFIQLPKLVLESISDVKRAIPANHRNDMRNMLPGPTNEVNSQFGRSAGSKGGNPPETTIVSDRAMKSMPSVVMKLGISNQIVT